MAAPTKRYLVDMTVPVIVKVRATSPKKAAEKAQQMIKRAYNNSDRQREWGKEAEVYLDIDECEVVLAQVDDGKIHGYDLRVVKDKGSRRAWGQKVVFDATKGVL